MLVGGVEAIHRAARSSSIGGVQLSSPLFKPEPGTTDLQLLLQVIVAYQFQSTAFQLVTLHHLVVIRFPPRHISLRRVASLSWIFACSQGANPDNRRVRVEAHVAAA